MKKNKLRLNELKVKSFLTIQQGDSIDQVKGGQPLCGPSTATFCPDCPPPIDR